MINRGKSTRIGSMYMYEANQTIVIDDVDEYHAVVGFSVGTVNIGFTFLASASGAITNTADNGGILRCTDVGHGLTTGQYVSLHGMGDADHLGETRVTVISTDVFDCDNIAYSSSGDTGDWTRGSSLTAKPGSAGYYDFTFTASMQTGVNNKNFKLELVKNVDHLDEGATERKIANGNDLGSVSAGPPTRIDVGDTVWLIVKCTTDATNLIIEHANVSVKRV